MPIYDYVCRKCGHVVEVIHGVYDAGPSECSVCGSEMRRAVSAPSVHFKGSGWAKKDRSSKAATSRAGGDSASAKSGESGESAKSGESSKSGGESAKSDIGTGPAASVDSSKSAASASSEAS